MKNSVRKQAGIINEVEKLRLKGELKDLLNSALANSGIQFNELVIIISRNTDLTLNESRKFLVTTFNGEFRKNSNGAFNSHYFALARALGMSNRQEFYNTIKTLLGIPFTSVVNTKNQTLKAIKKDPRNSATYFRDRLLNAFRSVEVSDLHTDVKTAIDRILDPNSDSNDIEDIFIRISGKLVEGDKLFNALLAEPKSDSSD